MRVLSTEIEDILSIKNAIISFEDSGLVLVEGWNYDTQRANGAGKTAIFNCLSFSLYDKLPRKITMSEVLRRGCKSGFVKTRVLCGDDVWTVIRSRPKGVKFLKNDVEQDITQAEFESFIRLSYEQFLLTIYTPQANSGKLSRFLSSPDSSKKEFLLQLLNLDQFSEAKKAVDEIIKQRQAAFDIDAQKVATARARIETYEESLIDADSVQATIHQLTSTISRREKEIDKIFDTPKPDLSKYKSTEENIKIKLADITRAKAKREMLHDRYRELSTSIQTYDPNQSCSECGSALDSSDARTAHSEHQQKIQKKMLDIKTQLDDLETIIAKENSLLELNSKLQDKKQAESITYQDSQSRIAELNNFIILRKQELKSAHLKLENNSELLNKINTLNDNVNKLGINMSNNKQELELYKTLSTVYSPTGAQAYVLDSIVDSFNEVIQKYIDMLSPNMSYVLNSFKETAKGDVVAKFSETLTKGGQEVSVGSLSGGEEKGLSLCVDFALLEVLETQFGMSLNPIVLDEPFDGLDMAGREIVISLLENLARNRQIMVVDHASESKAMFTKFIRVELQNDVSSVSVHT